MSAIGATRLAGLLGDTAATPARPAYEQVAEQVRVLVSDGRVPVGVRLPAERELAQAFGCSRTTIAGAYRRLREDGWAHAHRGSGTWTRLPDQPGRPSGAWAPDAESHGVLDLAHAAPPAPPQLASAVAAAGEMLPRELPGHGYHPGGVLGLRERIAERYTARGLPTTADNVVVTNGALHALTIALSVVTGPGDRVMTEHPTYPSALDAIADAGARCVPVADSGDLVEDLVRTARQTAPRAAYLVPDFHNPTGRLLDEKQRRRLARELVRERVTTIIDETFAEVTIDGEPPSPLAAHTRSSQHVLTLGTLSKVVWGGLRIGWIRTDEELAARLRTQVARAQIAVPVLEQLTAWNLFDDLDAIREQRRPQLRDQRDEALSLLAEHFPRWTVNRPTGGLFLWCQLDAPIATALAATAESQGLRIAPGPRFGTGHAFDDHLRLPFNHPRETLERAFTILADSAHDLTPGREIRERGTIV
jgi:DNA-binding transcriptional MocR family regulator